MDLKCALYISKCIWLVHKPSTKRHLGWANEKGSTLKDKPKNKIGLFKTYLPTSLPPYDLCNYNNLPTSLPMTYLLN